MGARAVEIAIMGGLRREDIGETTDASLLTLLRDRSYDGHPLGEAAASRSIGRLLDRYEERRFLKRCFVVSRPKDRALQCQACHAEKGRMDWKALGYDGDPIKQGSQSRKRTPGIQLQQAKGAHNE